MTGGADDFWDKRYQNEGAIWGDAPSPTALLAARHLREGDRVFEIGFGYGRDLAFLGQRPCRVSGIDLSPTGQHLAEERLNHVRVVPEFLWEGWFEEAPLPEACYDLVLCHRMAHLLVEPDSVGQFAAKINAILKPGGIACVGARNPSDLNPAEMIALGDHVYEYARRPGHRIRYWDDALFWEAFAQAFSVLSLTPAVEPEVADKPASCYLTIMVAKKRPAASVEA